MATRKGRPIADARNILVGSVIPSGTVQTFVGENAPTGYLVCDGSVVSRTEFSELFAIIGTSHGEGDGSTTFHLPDYRGRFLRGMDSGATRDQDAGSRTASNAGGNTGDAIGTVQNEAFTSHDHDPMRIGSGNGTATVFNNALASAGSSVAFRNYNHLTDEGGSETRPNNINVNYIIKV